MKQVSSRKTIAVFDFDGTLTTKDTLFDFTRFYYGNIRFFAGLILVSPTLILHKLGLVSGEKAKKSFLRYFFGNRNIESFNEVCARYRMRVNEIVNPLALKRMEWHRQQGHLIVIDSASPENWIKPWADSVGVDVVIATRLKVEDGLITGDFLGNNCNGVEKVNRLKDVFPDIESWQMYAYGDSSGDKELLALADYSFYRKFE